MSGGGPDVEAARRNAREALAWAVRATYAPMEK